MYYHFFLKQRKKVILTKNIGTITLKATLNRVNVYDLYYLQCSHMKTSVYSGECIPTLFLFL